MAKILLEEALPPAMTERLAQLLGGDPQSTVAWVSLVVGLHDLGKASPPFQSKWAHGRARAEGAGFRFPRHCSENIPHDLVSMTEGEILLIKRLGWARQTTRCLIRAAAAHHGHFPSDLKVSGVGPRAKGDDLWNEARVEIFEILRRAAGPPDTAVPQTANTRGHGVSILVAGLTTAADWLGSMADIFEFTPEPPSPEEYLALAQERARKAIEKAGWLRWSSGPQRSFEELFAVKAAWPLHKAARVLQEQLVGPALVLVEAPMGEGKTETALDLADHFGRKGGHSGVYIGLPTQATSNKMFDRVQQFLSRAHAGSRTNLQLVHGDAAHYDSYRRIQIRSVYGSRSDAGVVAEEWFSRRKRGLLATFAIGTVDQALLGVLRVRHGFLRLFGLAGKTVVLDEVHAYDTYTSTLLDRLVSWLSELGASVVLLSATLPRARRRQLVAAYAGVLPGQEAQYPRVTVAMNGSVCEHAIESRRPPSALHLDWVGPERRVIASMLVDRVADGGCAAWICNTVARAQSAWHLVREELTNRHLLDTTTLGLLHARLPLSQRIAREHAIDAAYGPSGCRPSRGILIGTQVLEQSLDLDFDVMVSDLAPVDLLLQRAGRLHRHERVRPPKLARPQMLLVRPDDEDVENGPIFERVAAVYERAIMLRTWIVLRRTSRLELPTDIESLVERVYGDAVPCSNDVSDKLARLVKDADRLAHAQANGDALKAEARLMPHPTVPDDPFAAFDTPYEEDDTDQHDTLRAETRLGEPSVSVVCLHQIGGEVYVDRIGKQPMDLDARPTPSQVAQLLGQVLSITRRGLVQSLRARGTPAVWTEHPSLRRRVNLLFHDGATNVEGTTLRLDEEMGLVIEPLDVENV